MSDRRIFISYRRTDAAGIAGRLADRIRAHFGRSSVFMDVDDIPVGTDFARFIQDAVASASATLVVIGRGWLGATTEEGRPRLQHPQDFVRLEIEAALRVDHPVIPVVVDDGPFPRSDQVPPSLQPLLRRNAFRLSHATFEADVARLIQTLTPILGDGESIAGERTHASHPTEVPRREDDVLEQLRNLIQRARLSKVPLARLLACVEEENCDALGRDAVSDDLEEHLRAFPDGNTRPIVSARLEVLMWKRATESRQPRRFAEYLVRFPHGAHVDRARLMRDQLFADMGGFDPDMPRVFLNYRRVDSQDTADRVYAILSETMPPQNIVMDVDKKSITPGLPIEPQLRQLVHGCDVMFALIHSRWLEELRNRQGQHESGQQIDFVRTELKCCLERGEAMPLVPVLAEGVEHPRATELPEDIRELSKRSSIHLSRDTFNEDVLGLLNRVVTHLHTTRSGAPKPM
jgi:hypothetical protein